MGIVLTHSCDLRHHDLTAEPVVEIAIAHRIEIADPMAEKSRNPRKLHLKVPGNPGPLVYELHAKDIQSIPRERFSGISCLSKPLNDESCEELLRWRARRYVRMARPDDLKKALDLKKKQITNWLKRANSTVSEMRIRFDPQGELAKEGERYQMEVLLLAKGSYSTIEDVEELDRLARALSEILESCGINSYGSIDRVSYDFLDTIKLSTYEEFIAFDIGDHLSDTPPALR